MTVGVSIAVSSFVEVGGGPVVSVSGTDSGAEWTVSTWSRPGVMLIHSHRERGANWTPEQATGAPDAVPATDSRQAWASSTQDSQREWLELEYDVPIVPRSIEVHETYNPGAVERITGFTESGEEVELWRGLDPTPRGSGAGVSHFPASSSIKTRHIKVYIDSPAVPGWNEIDAVGLMDGAGATHWATDAQASSTYGQSSAPASSAAPGVPAWSGLTKPMLGFVQRRVNTEDRLAKASGWPMVAFSVTQEGVPTATSSGPLLISRRISLVSTSASPATPTPMPLPLKPIWGGLLVDSLFYAALAGLFYGATVIPRRFLVEVSRMRRGCCIRCGYQLGYDFQHGCPDCGWGRDGELPPPNPHRSEAMIGGNGRGKFRTE